MPLDTKKVLVTVDSNPNLKTTLNTVSNLGVVGVSSENEVSGRSIGIPGPQGPKGDPGGLVWMGEWNSSTVYNEGESVTYQGSSYIYINQNPSVGNLPTNETYWGIMAEAGTDGEVGDPGIVFKGEWDNSTLYVKGDAVTYFGSTYIYIATYSVIGAAPTNTGFWDILALKGEQGEPGVSSDIAYAYTHDPTGFPEDRSASRILFDNSIRQFTIQPAIGGGKFEFMISGQLHEISAPVSIVIPNAESMFYIYFDTDDNLQYTTIFPATLFDIAMVAMLYWDSENQKALIFGEERHGMSMDWATHGYLHNTVGTAYHKGLDLFYTENGTGAVDSELQFGITDGYIYDEDLHHYIHHGTVETNLFEQVLYPNAHVPIFYRSGAQGLWRDIDATPYPVHFGTSRITFNHYNGNSWTIADVPDKSFCVMWVFATNDIRNPIISIMGQDTGVTMDATHKANTLANFEAGILPTPEFKLLYRITYEVDESFTNSLKARVVYVSDYRGGSDYELLHSAGDIALTGDKHFIHEQSVASSVWTVAHGMEKVPAVTVIDSGGNEVVGELEVVDINTVIIRFTAPFTGKVYFN